MSIMGEYIRRQMSIPELEGELQQLIRRYNQIRKTYLLVHVTATDKQVPDKALSQKDFYDIHDILIGIRSDRLDMYLETPGGSGEAAEDIVRYLHNQFDTVSFIVCGEAKSAGTIMVLSGHEILMTETGSLGPIDAQIKIGRSVQSASDYMDWIEEKRKHASKTGSLNHFDAIMVAQITPGELGAALHSLKFAEDLVKKWLVQYKFRDWQVTETHKKKVTLQFKRQRAAKIARSLIDHARWRSHGKSITLHDLRDEVGLRITRVEDHPELAEVTYRIQTVCRLLFENTTIYKILATADEKLFRLATPMHPSGGPAFRQPDAVDINQTCPKCGKSHHLFAQLVPNPAIAEEMKRKGLNPFPKNGIIKCECGFELDLVGIRNQIESETGKQIILE